MPYPRRRVFHQQAHHPQGVQAGLPADQEPQVLATGPCHAMGEEVVPGRVGNPVIGVVEQREVVPHLGQHLNRVCAQAPENRRKGH